jgi:PAS domain S-box-containing protein
MPSAPSPLESLPLTEVLEHVNVPSYLIDATGVIRWLNRAAENIVGDLRGRQFTSAVAPEDSRRARELFARKILGTTEVTDSGVVVVGADGTRVAVEISSVPIPMATTLSASSAKWLRSSRSRTRIPSFTSRRDKPRSWRYSSAGAQRERSPKNCTSAPRPPATTSDTCSGPRGPTLASKQSRSRTTSPSRADHAAQNAVAAVFQSRRRCPMSSARSSSLSPSSTSRSAGSARR